MTPHTKSKSGIEVWKWIPKFEGLYKVSNLGNVKSVDRIVVYRVGSPRHLKGVPIKTHRNKSGHLTCKLSKKAKTRTYLIHYLVMLAFVGERPPGKEIRHLNGKPDYNKLYNLKYGTRLENVEDSIRHGTKVKGERVGSAKLTNKQAAQIRRRYEAGELAIEIVKDYDVKLRAIHCVINRETFR